MALSTWRPLGAQVEWVWPVDMPTNDQGLATSGEDLTDRSVAWTAAPTVGTLMEDDHLRRRSDNLLEDGEHLLLVSPVVLLQRPNDPGNPTDSEPVEFDHLSVQEMDPRLAPEPLTITCGGSKLVVVARNAGHPSERPRERAPDVSNVTGCAALTGCGLGVQVSGEENSNRVQGRHEPGCFELYQQFDQRLAHKLRGAFGCHHGGDALQV